MRFFLAIFFSFFAFATEDVTGKWALSGVGCRDASLSPDSHVSKPLSRGHAGIRASTLDVFADGRANMTLDTRDQGEEFRSGTYTVAGDELRVNGADMTFHIVDDRLIVLGGESEATDVCCEFKVVESWRDYKQEIEDWNGEHPAGKSWEEVMRKNGWSEDRLVEDWETAKRRCREEESQVFVYVLGKVD